MKGLDPSDRDRLTLPHIRKLNGWWRVSKVPMKWHHLTEKEQARYRRAHDYVIKKNHERVPLSGHGGWLLK